MLTIRLSKEESIAAHECTCFNIDHLLTMLAKVARANPNAVHLQRCVRDLKLSPGLNHKRFVFESYKYAVGNFFGRKEQDGYVAYPPQAPVWFRNLMHLLKVDDGLVVTAISKVERLQTRKEKDQILTFLNNHWILGQSWRRTKHDVTHVRTSKRLFTVYVRRLRQLGMTRTQIDRFIARKRPSARRRMRSALIAQLISRRERVGIILAMAAAGTPTERRNFLRVLAKEFPEVEETWAVLERQSRLIGLQAPRMSWIAKYRAHHRKIRHPRTRPTTRKIGGNH